MARTLYCTYSPEHDWFLVASTQLEDGVSLRPNVGNGAGEYLRYVPGPGVSLDEVDRFLTSNPQELCCEITNACDSHCRVCIADAKANGVAHIDPEVLARSAHEVLDQVARVTITGGEPTLHPSLSEIVSLCGSDRRTVVLSTNGSNPEAVLSALEMAEQMVLAVSLHGPKRVHDSFVGNIGSYERALETITAGASICAGVHVLSVATRETLPTLVTLVDTLSETSITEHRISLVKPGGRSSDGRVSAYEVFGALSEIRSSHRVTVKTQDQPFVFLSHQGKLEERYGRNY